MATILKKRITRVTEGAVRDRGAKFRPIVVTLEPGDVISLRLKGTRFGTSIAISSVWHEAIRREAFEKARLKKLERKARREGRL